MKEKLKLLDVVAVTTDLPDQNLTRGQVGTIVELLDDLVYEVEFGDNQGRTYAMTSLNAEQLLLLHHEPAQA